MRTVRNRPLEGLIVLDFSQFLAGPMAGLRLADLGARVIKVERPEGGDICRQLYVANQKVRGDSTIFHATNRDKKGVAFDLKNEADLVTVKKLIARADVMIQNFRPSVIKRLGLDYKSVSSINPRLVYGSVSGYGKKGPWCGKPGQDLLAQCLSGITFLNSNCDQSPMALGLPIADICAGTALVQGILAKLVQRSKSGCGGLVEVSLLEALLDLQSTSLPQFLNKQSSSPQYFKSGGGNPFLPPPAGVYKTTTGYIAIGKTHISNLCEALGNVQNQLTQQLSEDFEQRESIRSEVAIKLSSLTSKKALNKLKQHAIPCCDVYDWPQLFKTEGFKSLNFIHEVSFSNGEKIRTTRCPITINGAHVIPRYGAPKIGESTQEVIDELLKGSVIPDS